MNSNSLDNNNLFAEIVTLIENSQHQVVSVVNSSLTMLFWQVGKKVNENILQNKRADYGKQTVSTLS